MASFVHLRLESCYFGLGRYNYFSFFTHKCGHLQCSLCPFIVIVLFFLPFRSIITSVLFSLMLNRVFLVFYLSVDTLYYCGPEFSSLGVSAVNADRVTVVAVNSCSVQVLGHADHDIRWGIRAVIYISEI